MRYCLSSRQPAKNLTQADEIKVQMRDWKQIFDLLDKYPIAKVVLEIESKWIESNLDWNKLEAWNKTFNNRLVICLYNVGDHITCEAHNLEWFPAAEIVTFFQLNGLRQMGVKECYVGAPLFFQMDKIAALGMKVRAVPNLAYAGYIVHEDGAHGTWIRPEDIPAYEPYVSVCEFANENPDDHDREMLLFNIYKKQVWEGDIGILIYNLRCKCANSFVAHEIMPTRLTCGQKCETRGSCHICDKALKFQKTVEKYRATKEAQKSNIDK